MNAINIIELKRRNILIINIFKKAMEVVGIDLIQDRPVSRRNKGWYSWQKKVTERIIEID